MIKKFLSRLLSDDETSFGWVATISIIIIGCSLICAAALVWHGCSDTARINEQRKAELTALYKANAPAGVYDCYYGKCYKDGKLIEEKK